MLTISKPLSSGQAQTYHGKEFTSAEQNLLENKATQYLANGRVCLRKNMALPAPSTPSISPA